MSVQEHYSLANEAFEKGNWADLARQSRIVIRNFPDTPFSYDAYFYLGVAYYNLQELALANDNFSAYLKKQPTPKFFEETFQYKYVIAKKFEQGEKKRLFGSESLPKWFGAQREAIEIYEEVIHALPQHDLAVQSLFGKATILFELEEFKESIETFQTLLRRFPRHPLALDSYTHIIKVYRTQGDKEYPDPDYLDLAEIYLKKFKQNFVGDPKVQEAQDLLFEMQELYAKDLYETAQFYERTKKPLASIIYYSKIITKYPNTKTSQASQERLAVLQARHGKQDLVIPKNKDRVLVDAIEESLEDVKN